jgi:2-C-methyl-D-erythritol 4-phosphate cytidylyltransferase
VAKRKRTNNDIQNTTPKTKDWAAQTPQKNEGEGQNSPGTPEG